jgi:hypothetical protein
LKLGHLSELFSKANKVTGNKYNKNVKVLLMTILNA